MLIEINTTVTDGIQSIDVLLKTRIEAKQQDPTQVFAAVWKEDESLHNSITVLKDIAKLLSNGCVKLVLLVRAKPSSEALISLFAEMNTHIKLLITHYL